jgi:hypothetical protein
MPRRIRNREIARRRKRKKERTKLRAKGLLPAVEGIKETEKKPKKTAVKESPKEAAEQTPKEVTENPAPES